MNELIAIIDKNNIASQNASLLAGYEIIDNEEEKYSRKK